jgi:signal transduction histidine kinase
VIQFIDYYSFIKFSKKWEQMSISFCKVVADKKQFINKFLTYIYKIKNVYIKKSGIPIKISVLVITISMVFLLLITIFQFTNSKMEIEKKIENDEELLIGRLKFEYVDTIWNYDKKSITNLVTAEMGNAVIKSILIKDNHYTQIIWLCRSDKGIVENSKEFFGKYIKKIVIPVIYSDILIKQDIIGYIDIWLDYSKIYADFYYDMIIDLARTILIILMIVVSILIVTITKLAKPLDSLRNKMKEVGDLIEKNETIDTKTTLSGNAFSEIKDMDHELSIMISKINTASHELKKINLNLEDLVNIRTLELIQSNKSLIELNENLERAYNELKNTQDQLITSEKMIILGNLVAGIAHELNTPLGAIISSNNMMKNMIDSLKTILKHYSKLDEQGQKIFHYLLDIVYRYDRKITDFTEDRNRRKLYHKIFVDCGFKKSELSVEMLIDIGFDKKEAKLKELLNYPDIMKLINDVYSISTYIKSYYIIKIASEKAANVINALKIYSYHNQIKQKIKTDIIKDIEIILTLYHNKIKYGVEIIRNFNIIPEVEYYSEKLNIVWSNLISNALYAMNYKGVLEINADYMDNIITVSIIDNGPGIPEKLKNQIFKPFFTTKKQGEGTGLGLDITKRILDEIGGKIEFESKPGRTKFTVILKVNGDSQ